MNNATRDTLLAKVYDIAERTPLQKAEKLSNHFGGNVYLKREDLQPIHSFKLRGAYNKMCQLTDRERKAGVIAASAGNHAQGVALAAKKLGISALIVMPLTTPPIKVEAVKSLGAEVELSGNNYSEAAEYCKRRVVDTGRTFIHPFDDPLVIAGQGTVGREIVEQLEGISHIFVPVGGGGLIAGIAQYVKELKPHVKIIAVEPEDSNVMQESLRVGRRITLSSVGIFADGVAVKQLGENTFKIAQQYVDDCVTVSTDQICAGIKSIFEETRSIVEPAGALGAAGIVKYFTTHHLRAGDNAVAICSGANMTFERLQFIAERTLLGSHQEALFAVAMPERAGSLEYFCNTVVTGNNITQFGYRLRSRQQAHIFVGIGVRGEDDKMSFAAKLKHHGYEYKDLSNEDIAKVHTRYMVGGESPNAQDEHLYEITFPERTGALQDFLAAVSGTWNISLFHYRGQGGDEASVLIGFEAKNKSELERALTRTGYSFENVDNATSLKLFA